MTAAAGPTGFYAGILGYHQELTGGILRRKKILNKERKKIKKKIIDAMKIPFYQSVF